jgi:hypothetical protein
MLGCAGTSRRTRAASHERNLWTAASTFANNPAGDRDSAREMNNGCGDG